MCIRDRADTAPFAGEDAVTELDRGRMVQERQRNTTFMPETDGYTLSLIHICL